MMKLYFEDCGYGSIKDSYANCKLKYPEEPLLLDKFVIRHL